jgi:hypothetical protein
VVPLPRFDVAHQFFHVFELLTEQIQFAHESLYLLSARRFTA